MSIEDFASSINCNQLSKIDGFGVLLRYTKPSGMLSTNVTLQKRNKSKLIENTKQKIVNNDFTGMSCWTELRGSLLILHCLPLVNDHSAEWAVVGKRKQAQWQPQQPKEWDRLFCKHPLSVCSLRNTHAQGRSALPVLTPTCQDALHLQ